MRVDALTGSLLYLDTNVFINAAEGFPQNQKALKALLLRVEKGAVHALTSELTLMEVLVRPLRENNARLVQLYQEMLFGNDDIRVVPIDLQVLRRAAELRATTRLKPMDALHAATAQLNACDVFISDDRRLNGVPLKVITVEALSA